MQEVKSLLHITDDTPTESSPISSIVEWPIVSKQLENESKLDQWSFHVHLKIRKVTQKLYHKIMVQLPIIISKVTSAFVQNEINGKTVINARKD